MGRAVSVPRGHSGAEGRTPLPCPHLSWSSPAKMALPSGPCVWEHREHGAGWHRPQKPLLWQSTPRAHLRGKWSEPLHLARSLHLSDPETTSPLACSACLHPPGPSVLLDVSSPCGVPFLPSPPLSLTSLLPVTSTPLLSGLALTKLEKSGKCDKRKPKRVRISLAVSAPLPPVAPPEQETGRARL